MSKSVIVSEYERKGGNMSPVEVLNHYRNQYYKEPQDTEEYIVANAINEILPEYSDLKKNKNQDEKKPMYSLEILDDNTSILDKVLHKGSKEQCINFADKIIYKIMKYNSGLLGELNDMQINAINDPLFENKYTIPDYFINLILQKYHMRLRKLYFEREEVG